MLQRLLDRLQRRQRVIRLLLARQPMLRQTVVGRRMVRAYGYLPASEPMSYYPAESELLAPPVSTAFEPAPPPIADLLPEPLVNAQPQAQPPARLRVPAPIAEPHQQPAPIAAAPAGAPGLGVRQAGPVPGPQQQIVAPTRQSVAADPQLLDAAATRELPRTQAPEAAGPSDAATASSPAAELLVPPVSTAAGFTPPASTPVVPTSSESTDRPQSAPARRRRGQFVELPVAPEVARSLAQAAGDRSALAQPQDQAVSQVVPPSGPAADQAAAPVQPSNAELFTSTPARSAEEWGRMLTRQENPAAQPEVIAEAQAEPPLAPVSLEEADVAASTRSVEPAAQLNFAPASDDLIGSDPLIEASDPAFVSDGSAAAVPVLPTQSALPVVPPDAPQAVMSADDLLTAATAPVRSPAADVPTQPVPPPTATMSVTQPEGLSHTADPVLPSLDAAQAPTSSVAAPGPAMSAMQRTIERVTEVLRREAEAARLQPAAQAQLPASNQVLPPRAQAGTIATERGAQVAAPRVTQQDAQAEIQQPAYAPDVDAGTTAPQSAAVDEPTAASTANRAPSRRSRFEEIPASARQPAPKPEPPAGERRLNPRPWIPQRPGETPAGPRLSDELFQEENGRSAQDWSKLLFEATHPSSWKRLPESAPTPQALPDAAQQSPIPAPTNRPVAPVSQQQDTNRPVPARAGHPADTGAPQSRLQALPASQATSLRDSTRRFLRPIVGIDPGDVRIYRGAEGARVTAALGAEGASSGDRIALGPGNEDESRPQTLGLLAHELTHTARSGDASFIPPIAQGAVSHAANEEEVAQAAEQQAVRAARRFVAPTAVAASPIAAQATPASPRSSASAGQSGLWGAAEPSATIEAPDRSYWGDLPAPWEPLPDWMNGPAQGAAPPSRAPTPTLPTSPSGFASGDAVPAVPATYLAEIDREIQTGETQAQPQPQQQAAPAPDIDAMARQVYDMLKQRLAAERRRLG